MWAVETVNTWMSTQTSLLLLQIGQHLPGGRKANRISVFVDNGLGLTLMCRSEALIKIAAKHEAHSALVADILALPCRPSFFDFAISIAVIHHLSTPARRVQAIAAILEALSPVSGSSGKALIYVWALEQQQSRRGWGERDEQDVMVPWVMKGASVSPKDTGMTIFHRYYHLYRSGELERDISAAGGTVLEAGYEKDNWWAIATRHSDSTLHGLTTLLLQ